MLKSFSKVLGVGILGIVIVLGTASIVKTNTVTEATTSVIALNSASTLTVVPAVNNNFNLNNSNNDDKLVLLKPGNAEQLIIFNTPVVYETVEATLARLETLKAKGYKEAFLILDSPGGSVFDGARLVAWMKHSPMKVHTICDGMCASMAAHLFEVGKVRYMTDKSTLMFHPASGGVQGTLEQMHSRLNFVQTYVDRLDAAIAARAGIDYDTFKQRTLVEYWVETEDAVKNRLADNLVFISYNRSATGVLNMEDHLRKLKKIVPEELRRPGILRLETIRLNTEGMN